MQAIKKFCCLVGLFCAGVGTLSAQQPTLRFHADKKFKIVQFTDVHWKPGNPASDIAAERMDEVLDAEKPDLVIYTGDVVYGKPAKQGLDEALKPVLSRHIPFCVTFGNHDDEQDLSRRQLYDYIKTLPGNLTADVEGLSGVTNFILPIKSGDGKADSAVIYVFDSHSYSKMKQIKGYDWIKADQIAWYRQRSAEFTSKNQGRPLPALAFFHIPVPEYNEAAQAESAQLMGYRGEKACAPQVNSGLFTAILEQGDVMGTFVGHDHVNDYLVNWKGIALCYGRYTGGNTVYNDIPGGNGARVIELTQGERSFRTWIRLKDGLVKDEMTFPTDLPLKK